MSEKVLKNSDSIVEIGNVLPNLHHVVVLIAPPLSELDQWDSLSLFQGLHLFVCSLYLCRCRLELQRGRVAARVLLIPAGLTQK